MKDKLNKMKNQGKIIKRRKRRAQSILEYVVVFLVVLVALAIMSRYVKRGLVGKGRETGNVFGRGEVYDYKPGGGGTVVEETYSSQ